MKGINNEIDSFEDVLYIIGNNGPFQKRFRYLFNLINIFVVTLPYLNIVLALLVPDHWCNVPGRSLTNLTVEEWKNVTLPMEQDSSGRVTYSSCTMYNISNIDRFSGTKAIGTNLEVVDCQHGWEYNREWYSKTIPTVENWVCEKSIRVATAFMYLRVGELGGQFLVGIFTDRLGRKPVFYVCMFVQIISRFITIVTPSYYFLFLLACALSNSTAMPILQNSLIVSTEILHPDARGLPAVQIVVAWSLGITILPCVMWLTGDWFTYMVLTTMPTLIYFIISARYMIESPRWLLNRGKINSCIAEMTKIAEVNKTKLPADIYKILSNIPTNSEKSLGYFSLFSHWRIARNTFCAGLCLALYQVSYYSLMLNVENLNGNPLLNFLLQGLVELPGYICGKVLSDYFGRRFANVAAYMGTGLGYMVLILTIRDPNYAWLGTSVAVFLKFTVSAAYFAITLQSMEMYPTCLRQTGLSFVSLISNAFAIFAPYIVYMGTSIDARLPYVILSCASFISVVCAFFLPETLHQRLPDTIAESQMFGTDQSYFSLPKRRYEFEPVKSEA